MSSEEQASPKRWWILFGVSLGVLMSTIDGSIVNIALRTLVQELHTSFAMVEWVVLSYLLVITALLLGVARLGDILGKKRIYTAGLAIFTLGSLLCGIASDVGWLIAFRAVQGMGAVMVMALGTAIVTEAFPPRERGRALGIVGSAVSVGVAIGPSLGGVLLGTAGWRSIFLVNLPIGILAVAIVSLTVPNTPPAAVRQRFDVVGALVLTATMVCYALGMTLVQERGLADPLILGLMAVSLVGIVAFIAVESKVAQPMIQLGMFRNVLFSLSLALGVIVFVVMASNTLIMPFFLEQGMGYSVTQTGLMLAVVPVVTAVIAPFSGWLSDRYGPRIISLIGLAIMVVGYFLAATLSQDVGIMGYFVRMVPISIGIGVFQSPNNSAVMNAVRRDQIGVASGLLALSRTIGQTTGIPLMGALFAGYVASSGSSSTETAAPAAIVLGTQGTLQIAAWGILAAFALAAVVFWLNRHRLRPAASAAPVEAPILAD